MTQDISLPQPNVSPTPQRARISDVLSPLHTFLNAATSGIKSSFSSLSDQSTQYKIRRQLKKNKFFFIPLVVIVILLVIGIVTMIRNANSGSASIAGAADNRIELEEAIDTQNINKTFSFPLKDASGKEVSKIKLTLEKAELRDEIIVKGQKATSVKGRTFLILPIKIQNDFNQRVEINVRDYIRLIINNNTNERLAPDIHNDPVEVQAISTKATRVGFPINDTDKALTLQIGEINGDKENIKLDLSK